MGHFFFINLENSRNLKIIKIKFEQYLRFDFIQQMKRVRFISILPLPILLFLTNTVFSKQEKIVDTNNSLENKQRVKEGSFETITPQMKDILISHSLNGFFEDPEAVPFSVETEDWNEIKVVRSPVHGKTVGKGDQVITFDLERIRNKIGELKYELSIKSLNLNILSIQLKKDEEINDIELSKIERATKYNATVFDYYKTKDLPYEKKSAVQELKRYEESLSYSLEELNQLKKMYEEDDLTEETEEIIITRTQNEVNRLKFALEGAQIRNEKNLKIQIPKSELDRRDSFNLRRIALNTDKAVKPQEIKIRKLEIKKIEEEKKHLQLKISRLEKDLNKLKAPSPIQGTIFVGTFDFGKWSGKKLFEPKLKKGGILKPYEEFLTICPLNKIQAKVVIPEKKLFEISKLNKGVIESATHPNFKFPAKFKISENLPITPGNYSLTANIEIPKEIPPPLPGTSCVLEVVSYKKEKALTLPISSVFQDKNKPEVDYVYVLSKKNKPIKKIIEKGKISESIVEILKGLTQKTRVLKK